MVNEMLLISITISINLVMMMAMASPAVTENNILNNRNNIINMEIKISGVNLTANNISIDNISVIFGESSDSTENHLKDSKNFTLITRNEWMAQPPINQLTDLELPSTRVIIAHTASTKCTTQAECTFRVRSIQNYHIESRNWDDIGYNFLVGGDGVIYEGRGWDKQGAHTKGYNVKSIGLAFIGTFNKIKPTDGQLDAAKLLIQEGMKLGKLSKDYKLFGHRQLIATESPGDALYDIIKEWQHYSSNI